MTFDAVRLAIDHLGRRGEGVAHRDGDTVYVPYALPGETVLAERDGERARIVETLVARPDRLEPVCPYYGTCGGCAVQTLPAPDYLAWKRDLVVTALAKAGLDAPVAPALDAHGAGRRRATFHSRLDAPRSPPRVGFMQARAHAIVDLAFCPILSSGMAGALPAARRVAAILSQSGRPLDIVVTATDTGLDLDLRGLGKADHAQTRALISAAAALDLARLSNHGDVLVEARAPTLRMGRAALAMPPGAFLQATAAGEEALVERVRAGIGGAKRVADLFCGVGTFALRLGETASVTAVDSERAALAALVRAAAGAPGLRQPKTELRDLFKRPLAEAELAAFDAVVFDPPRAGAAAQAAEIARSGVPRVVAVSCDPGTFARDAATLVAGGYRIESVEPVDQFRYSAHVELVALFTRPAAPPKKRKLLS
ncbi:class I SAM-dependent RNA methyltransferase [Lichenibacterium minor]|uniref:Class I SAM-dependent RNA methyltransferase n=1 Tax=Lichenibacterium minor TaxID=2316528 RepID=A0A4V1RUT5_9HYPH|nr:class I SAM-dependent RNA methyltransferase [Lichenibacterium minor]RYC32274.1 class I SAM-dependent RNA methyltransferase [Lichenibacterium minor]